VRIEAAIREQHASAAAADLRARECGDNHPDASHNTLPPLPPKNIENGEEFDSESRRLWVLQALKGRSSLLIIDQADYLSQPHSQLRSSYGGAGVETELDEVVSGDSGKDEDDDLEDGGGSMDDLENEDLKTFLDELFDAARSIKILLASSMDRPLLVQGGGVGRGVVEATVSLNGLSLRDSVRLFCRLSPKLRTAKEREQCLSVLVPPETTASSLSHAARNNLRKSRLLEALGNGMPGRIVHVALAETSLELLMGIAKNTHEKPNERSSPLTVVSTALTTIPPQPVTSTGRSRLSGAGGGGGGGVTSSLDPLTPPPPVPLSLTPSVPPQPRSAAEISSRGSSSLSPRNTLNRANEGAELTRQSSIDLEDVPH
jgi:hypothetical protein